MSMIDTTDAPRRIALVGAPVEAGASQGGCVMGPAALRTAGLADALARLGHTVEDHGDLAPRAVDAVALPGHARNAATVAGWARVLSDHAAAAMASGALPIFLGGDHSLSMGSVDGASRHWRAAGRELFVLWLDAHADFNTPLTTPSGNMHGMSLALLCGEEGADGVLDPASRVPVDPSNVCLFGLRSVDREERALVIERGVQVFDMHGIDVDGVSVLVRRVLDAVEARDGVLHVSLDVDFLDPSIAPGVGTTVPGGITYREAHLIMELLHDSGRVGSIDLVELNPFLDERGRSALVMVELAASLLGRRVLDRQTRAPRAA